MVQTNKHEEKRIKQGDIISNVECVEFVQEKDGVIEVSLIEFPLVIVLSQDCDLTWDFVARNEKKGSQDKEVFSVIVAPLYNYEHFVEGMHLSELGMKMQAISKNPNKTDNKNLKNNETPRYHYLKFDDNVPIVPSVIDFKHFFTVNVETITKKKETNYVCTVSELFRERITQRFANYLSRIGLPEATNETDKKNEIIDG